MQRRAVENLLSSPHMKKDKIENRLGNIQKKHDADYFVAMSKELFRVFGLVENSANSISTSKLFLSHGANPQTNGHSKLKGSFFE